MVLPHGMSSLYLEPEYGSIATLWAVGLQQLDIARLRCALSPPACLLSADRHCNLSDQLLNFRSIPPKRVRKAEMVQPWLPNRCSEVVQAAACCVFKRLRVNWCMYCWGNLSSRSLGNTDCCSGENRRIGRVVQLCESNSERFLRSAFCWEFASGVSGRLKRSHKWPRLSVVSWDPSIGPGVWLRLALLSIVTWEF